MLDSRRLSVPTLSLRHVALNVVDLEAALRFYVDLIGMQVEWQPDADNVYLTLGADNLALHRVPSVAAERGALDHIGFVVKQPEDVDAWADRFRAAGVVLAQEPKTHRDGARSFYARDPAGNVLQVLYHPPISPRL
jgi:catechol 2,3-dioxygenase-like lactoylglutathione lyase family enzyme